MRKTAHLRKCKINLRYYKRNTQCHGNGERTFNFAHTLDHVRARVYTYRIQGYKDTRIQGYKSDNYFIEFTIVIILK